MINCDAEGMTEHYPVLILLVPLFGALLATLLGSERQVACWFTALIALGGSSILAIGNICALLASAEGELRYRMGGWNENSGYEVGIELRIDMLAALVVAAVVIVGFINTIFAKTRVTGEMREKAAFFYALNQLLIVGLCGIVMTNDAFNLYVLIEITSLTSYALIAMATGVRHSPVSITSSWELLGPHFTCWGSAISTSRRALAILTTFTLYCSPVISGGTPALPLRSF